MSLRHNVLVLFSLFFVLQTGCLEHHGRVFGGGRIKDGNYYVLEDSAWTLWWLTIIFPSVMTHMTTWHEIRVGDDNEERSLVDWMWWNGTTSPLGIPRDVEVYRWILDGELLNPNISLTQPNQRIRLLCNDLESYALLIQEERRLSAKYRHGPFALYERTGEFYTWIPPSVWNCSLLTADFVLVIERMLFFVLSLRHKNSMPYIKKKTDITLSIGNPTSPFRYVKNSLSHQKENRFIVGFLKKPLVLHHGIHRHRVRYLRPLIGQHSRRCLPQLHLTFQSRHRLSVSLM